MFHHTARRRRTQIGGLIAAAATAAGLFANAGGALAGQAVTDKDGLYLDLGVTVTPPVTSTRAHPQGAGITIDSFSGDRLVPDTPTRGTSTTVLFNRGFKDNGRLFPACEINPPSLSQCSPRTQIGTGNAEVEILGSGATPPSFVPTTLRAYNGRPLSGSAPTVILVALLNGKPAGELDFVASQRSTGPYGLELTQVKEPGVTPAQISKFQLTIGDRTVSRHEHGGSTLVPLLQAPSTCTGSWRFAQIDTYSDEPPLTATDTQPCVRR
jgi:hypothetical protein